VPKLVLKVSNTVPELPAAVRKEKGLSMRRVRTFSPGADNADLVAWFVDADFIAAHSDVIREAGLAPGSVLLWNPTGGSLFADTVPAELVFDEIFSFKNPSSFKRTVRNLFRQMHLQRELSSKEAILKLRETENSELLQVGIALSVERDNNKLLDYILRQLRQISRADAGTLYLLEKDPKTGDQKMRFKITQNDSNPRDYSEFVMPLSK
jgi:hypothetical protein